MNLGARMAAWYGDLPAGCRHVKYLKSSGPQYIITGVYASHTMRVVEDTIWGLHRNGSNYYHFDGFGDTSYNVYLGAHNNLVYVGLGGDDSVANTTGYPLVRHLYDMDFKRGVLKIDGTTFLTKSPLTEITTVDFSLFRARDASNNVISRYDSVSTKWSVQLYDNDVLKRDFIPIVKRTGGTDTPYFYDKVTRTYLPFGNAGTGTFGWEEMDGTVVSPT